MPTIPQYEVPQEQLRPLANARQESAVSPGMLDTAARQTEQLGAGVFAAGIRYQEREDADMVFRAETGLKDDYLKFENDIRNRRGQAAWGSTQDAAKWWDDNLAKNTDTLQNNRQKFLFQQQAQRMRQQSLDGISKHEADQRRVSLEESAQASIVGSINTAAANADNPAVINSAKEDINKRVQVMAQLNGWAPDVRDAKQAEYLTNLHMQVIQNKIDADPEGAKEYFEANKNEINGSQWNSVEKAYKTSNLRKVGQEAADAVMAMEMSEGEALEHVRKEYNGDEEVAAVQEIKTRFAEREMARERSQRDAADEAYGIYARSGRLDSIPAATLNGMDGRVLLALRKQAEADLAGKEIQTDWEKYYGLKTLAQQDPQKFAGLDLRGYFGVLGKGERKEMIELQTKAKSPDELHDVATLEQQLGAVHEQLGWKASDMEKKGQFDSVVRDAINTEQRALGKPLTYDQRQAIIDRMTIQSTQGVFSHPRYYEVQGTDAANTFTPKIPETERVKIESALRRNGLPITDAGVMKLYKQKHGLK